MVSDKETMRGIWWERGIWYKDLKVNKERSSMGKDMNVGIKSRYGLYQLCSALVDFCKLLVFA